MRADTGSLHEPVPERVPAPAAVLLPLVYEQLRNVARSHMGREPGDHTLQPTALVHEAYLRVVRADGLRPWDSRWHFFAAVAEAMRRILVERARRKHSTKHGGGLHRLDPGALTDIPAGGRVDLLELDDALRKFAACHPEKARLVMLKYFAGIPTADAAEVMGLSPSTAERYWAFAKAWLFREMAP